MVETSASAKIQLHGILGWLIQGTLQQEMFHCFCLSAVALVWWYLVQFVSVAIQLCITWLKLEHPAVGTWLVKDSLVGNWWDVSSCVWVLPSLLPLCCNVLVTSKLDLWLGGYYFFFWELARFYRLTYMHKLMAKVLFFVLLFICS